ncbi:zf-TFIIB domain-containing protein [Allokutzneria sp. NRRL B-24872]|uniref:TFIIB-type zinc ribbon-containing protein n=1 Tax=Allokutzneria sp. NRRL B-24872 TaxID=1137961 RepID=UPI000A3CD5F4|nr:zf-TFIIB domain-containing protein [Allokutzneria sp. NRRL B-24872]
MICPKCSDVLVTYERNGVHVDQCRGCQGLYLDRGELEQLVRASSTYFRSQRDDHRKKRRRDEDDSFIEDILEFII